MDQSESSARQINSALNNVFRHFLESLSLQNAVSRFYDIINRSIDKNVPKRGEKGKYPFWYSKQLIAKLKSKERARTKWKRSNRDDHYEYYSRLRAETKSGIEFCYQQYINDLQNNIKDNIKLFWSYTKKKKQSNTYPSVLKYGNSCSDDDHM